MNITITGKQIEVGDALREHATTRLAASVSKYFEDGIEAHVAFSREGPFYRTAIRVHVGKSMAFDGRADGADAYASFAAVVEGVDKQMRRHKRRRRDHGTARPPADLETSR